MQQSSDSHFIPMTSVNSGTTVEAAPDVYCYTDQIVNLVMIGLPGSNNWVLVDAGMPKTAGRILEAVEERFGNQPPAAILLTHGHFDHVGSIVALLDHWNCPVYAHPLEFPFLTGQEAYPEPDSSVEGGLLAKIASLYPHEPVNITEQLKVLPADGTVPFLPGWQGVHVPGHSPGQVAFYRSSDGLLLSGDAFVTVRQDALYNVLMQKKEVNGPPRYLTTDWDNAKASVQRLYELHPQIVVPGHGEVMRGSELEEGLHRLVTDFDTLALPAHGRYVHK